MKDSQQKTQGVVWDRKQIVDLLISIIMLCEAVLNLFPRPAICPLPGRVDTPQPQIVQVVESMPNTTSFSNNVAEAPDIGDMTS